MARYKKKTHKKNNKSSILNIFFSPPNFFYKVFEFKSDQYIPSTKFI